MAATEEVASIPWDASLTEESVETLADDVEKRAAATVRAYKKLGLIQADADDIELTKVVADAYRGFAATHGDIGELYVAVPLENGSVIKLYHAFRETFKAYSEPWMELWGQYDDPVDFGAPKVDSNKIVVRAMVTGGESNSYDEVGLYETDKTVANQRKAGNERIKKFNADHDGLAMGYFDPGSYILINAIRLELGLDPLDCRTFTRFVGMTEKSADGDVCVPYGDWSVDWLYFRGSYVDISWDSFGVRFSVGEEEEA